MPRSGNKGRGGKRSRSRSRKSASQVTSPETQEKEVEDVKPDSLTQARGSDMLAQEDKDETVGQTMQELTRKTMEGCLKVDIQKELIPYTASWAISYLSQTVEQRLLCLDEGEGSEEASLTEDSEPVPTIADPWAPGGVRVISAPLRRDPWVIPAQTAPEVKQKCNAVVQTRSTPKQSEKVARPSKPLMVARNKVPRPCPSPKVDQTKKQPMKIPPRPAQGKLPVLPPLSRSAKQMDVKNQNSGCSVSLREPGSVNQRKGCQPILRLDPASLPRHSILPQYEILDANYTTQKGKKQSGPSKFGQRHEKQPTEGTVTSLKPPTSSKDQSARFQRTKEADCRLNKLFPSRHSMEGRVSAGPLRLDKMELAKGVLRHPRAVDINTFKVKSPSLSTTKYKVIQSAKFVPLYSAEEITAGPPPRVIPLFQSKRCDT